MQESIMRKRTVNIIMRNVLFHDNDSEPDERRSFISIDGDGNETEADKVL